jgi:hypothetical protein
MILPTPDDAPPLDADGARILARVRRLMALALLLTAVAVAAVLVVIGYRIFRSEGTRAPAAEVAAPLPPGARIISTVVADGRIVLTIETAAGTELRVFDLATLQPRGRLMLAPGAPVSAPVR